MDLHLNDFATVAEYNTFMSGDYLRPNVSYIEEIGGVKYQKDAPAPPEEQYLTFEALEDGTFQLSGNSVDYSLDGGATWTTLAANTATPTVTSGSTIMWRGTLSPTSNGIGTFTSTGNFNAKGNPMSLLFGDNFIGQTDLTGKDYVFYKLFYDNTKIVNVQNLILPATTLASNCYNSMFYNCTSLTTAPAILPATTLTQSCYNTMFRGCTSLTTSPELPATTMAPSCYQSMLRGCTSLTTAPELPATALAQTCYGSMFSGCTSLTTAPELPATTLANTCYGNMFYGCPNLNSIKMLATDVSANSPFLNWVSGVSATGTFTKATGVTIPSGVSGIPSGWTVVEQ